MTYKHSAQFADKQDNIVINYGEEFILGETEITKLPLDNKSYSQVFIAMDMFGYIYTSDTAIFDATDHNTFDASRIEPSIYPYDELYLQMAK